MGPVRTLLPGDFLSLPSDVPEAVRAAGRLNSLTAPLGVTVSDLLYVGLTIVVFAVLILIVKGVERFER
jgi:hypothetical protein